MIKKIQSLFVGTLVVFSMPALVFADEHEENEVDTESDITTTSDNSETVDDTIETEEVEEETSEEMEETESEMNEDENKNGEDKKPKPNKKHFNSEMRSHGLYDNLMVHVKASEIIISKLETMDTEVSVEELLLISAKFDTLLEQVNELDLENTDKETLKVEMDLIRDSGKEISSEFRTLLKGVFSEQEKESIRDEINELRDVAKENRKEEMKMLRTDMMVQKTMEFLERLGVDSEDIVSRIESGDLSKEDIKSELRKLMKSIKSDKINQIKEDNQRKKIEMKDKVVKAKEEHTEKREAFKNEMREKYEAHKIEIMENKEAFKERMYHEREEFREKAQEMKKTFKKRAENIKNKSPEFREKLVKIKDKVKSGELTLEDAKDMSDEIIKEMESKEEDKEE